MEINKSADSTVEFFGIRGIYVPYTIGGILGVFLLFLILQSILPPALNLALTAGILGAGIHRIKYLDKKYGDQGMDKLQARRMQPRRIRHQNAAVFTQLIRPTQVGQ